MSTAVPAPQQRLSGFIPKTAPDVQNFMEASDAKCRHSNALSVLIDSEPELRILVFTRFLHANRHPLRSKSYRHKFTYLTADRKCCDEFSLA
jgi:hypothetical protein